MGLPFRERKIRRNRHQALQSGRVSGAPSLTCSGTELEAAERPPLPMGSPWPSHPSRAEK